MSAKRIALLGVTNSLAAVAGFLVFPTPVGPMDTCSDYLSRYRHGFQISDRSDLDQLLNDDVAEACSDEILYLRSVIDLNGLASPIDNWHGTFNGNGFRLIDSNPGSELSPDPEPSLFDSPDGDIEIINVIRVGDVSGGTDVGGLIGQTSFAVRITNSHTTGNTSGNTDVGGLIGVAIGDVTITNSYTTGNTSGGGNVVGGLIGYAVGDVTITDSYTTGDTTGNDFVGGLIGAADGPTTTVTNSYTTGDTTGVNYAGGLIGLADSPTTTITNSYTTGNTTAELYFFDPGYSGGTVVGGLIGESSGAVEITNSYTTGDTTGHYFVGGLIGAADGPTTTVTNSYTTGDTTGDPYIYGGSFVGGLIGAVGGLIGAADGPTTTVTNSYTTGDTTGVSDVGGLIGDASAEPTIVNSLCLDSSDGCLDGDGVTGTSVSAADLKSRTILSKDYDWNFSSVWCFSHGMNDGFPVLRAIDFGPGDTNCRNRGGSSREVTLDPAGGVCAGHPTPWRESFRSTYSLPTATDCTRDGHVFLGWTRDPALTAPENLLTSRVARSGTLTAVWGQLPTAPSVVNVLANFLCRQNCDSALIVWPSSSNPSDTAVITLDGNETTCSTSGEISGLKWCLTSGLAPGGSHTATVAWRNQYGTGPTASAIFTLN